MSMIDVSDVERRIAERIDPKAAQRLAFSNEAGGLGFADLSQAMEFAKMMAVSSIAVPKHLRNNVGACMAVVIQAVEWRMSPYAVANKSYSVNDRLAYESQLVQAVILQRAPIKGRFKVEFEGEGAKRRCRVAATLQDGSVVDYLSPEFDRIPVKNSPLWKSDPDQQLFYYSGRALCRRHFPDVLLGIYTPEELAGEAPHHGPERARDVTPPKSLAAKLDLLARGGGPAPEHDPATGEITQGDESRAPLSPGDSRVAGADATDAGGPEAPEGSPASEASQDQSDPLLDEAREKAMDGRRVFDAWFAGLSPAARDELKPHTAALMKAANAADGRD
jgi:hypothetical protein